VATLDYANVFRASPEDVGTIDYSDVFRPSPRSVASSGAGTSGKMAMAKTSNQLESEMLRPSPRSASVSSANMIAAADVGTEPKRNSGANVARRIRPSARRTSEISLAETRRTLAPHEDSSAQVFQFDFSVFDFLQHEALQSPRDTHGLEPESGVPGACGHSVSVSTADSASPTTQADLPRGQLPDQSAPCSRHGSVRQLRDPPFATPPSIGGSDSSEMWEPELLAEDQSEAQLHDAGSDGEGSIGDEDWARASRPHIQRRCP